jgi:3',5'-cyclic AMP phosphodiesterase CpdA
MNSNSSLRILHISDLHFTSLPRKEEVYGGRTIPRDVLTEDVSKKFIRNFKDDFLKHYSEDQRPKIVIISGDLVEQGGHDTGEFDRARDFLSELAFTLGIEKKRIFVVPGNHDVNWYKGLKTILKL